MSRVVLSIQGETLDAIVWREYPRAGEALPIVLAANGHLRGLPPILPTGTRVTLPDAPATAPTRGVEIWD